MDVYNRHVILEKTITAPHAVVFKISTGKCNYFFPTLNHCDFAALCELIEAKAKTQLIRALSTTSLIKVNIKTRVA